jgi:hypothetical protein
MKKSLYVEDPQSNLYTMDSTTGSVSMVGAMGISNVTDIAFHGPTLYGTTFNQFLRIDPKTATSVVVGNIGIGSTNSLAVASNGTIYGLVYASGGGQLITINPVTGVGTSVGSLGSGLTPSGDLSFDENDNLYATLNNAGTVQLATINLNTGAATLVGNIGFSDVYGLAFYCCNLYGATASGELLKINAATGAGTLIGGNNLTHWGMAADHCCSSC